MICNGHQLVLLLEHVCISQVGKGNAEVAISLVGYDADLKVWPHLPVTLCFDVCIFITQNSEYDTKFVISHY